MPERLNGYRKTPNGVYTKTADGIRADILTRVPELDKLPAVYVPQGNELKKVAAARAIHKAVLFTGPTGIGKTLAVHTFAAVHKLPLLVYIANEDATDYKMRGSLDAAIYPMQDAKGHVHEVKFKVFTPNQVALAAMSDIPVVLFIDEIHKIRQGITPLIHSITNPSERTLFCDELTGESYKLHPDTLVVAALNPSYGEGGIDRLDAALRRRFATIPLDMPDADKIVDIVKANVGHPDGKSPGIPDADKTVAIVADTVGYPDDKRLELIRCLAAIQAAIYAARAGSHGAAPSQVVGDNRLDSETLSSIIEVPSPASIVDTVKCVLVGLPIMDSIQMNMIDTIVTDFGHARRALITYFESMIPEGLRS